MEEPATDQARKRHDGELDDAAQLPMVFPRFCAVRRMRNPTQVRARIIRQALRYTTIDYIILL